jgi:hypothetical protein
MHVDIEESGNVTRAYVTGVSNEDGAREAAREWLDTDALAEVVRWPDDVFEVIFETDEL